MSGAFTKTISLLLLIAIGYLFQRKIHSKEQREGIKTLILSLALPATILIALLQIDFSSDLIVIPIMSLAFNVLVYLLINKLPLQNVFGIQDSQYRTLVMLIPSLAPGLSCFPFIMEYSGQGPLAMAALADVGNKVFVLVISYTIAMKWYFDVHRESSKGKLDVKQMLIAMVNEPVNIVIIVAIVMLSFGLTYTAFPEPITLTIDRLSLVMTPMILLFIGLSMKLHWGQVKTIFSFLFFRSSIAFALSGAVLYFFPTSDIPTMLLIVVFPQSACSFWPYAHMAYVGQLERKADATLKTFDQDFAMNVLACSMPFSVILIMIVYATGDIFTSASTAFMSSAVLLAAALGIALASSRAIRLKTHESLGIGDSEEAAPPQVS
ncbi:MAG TPA: permease [Chryseosolibacter sp.]